VTGDQDWGLALASAAGGMVGAGAVVLFGGTPLQRGMRAVERVVPASSAQVRPPRPEWPTLALFYGACFVWFGVVDDNFALGATVLLLVSLVFGVEARRVRRWERHEGGRLTFVARPAGRRLRHPFRTPECVLVLDPGPATPTAPGRDAQAASSSSVALSGAPSK
jgi:hypothetical protein